MAVPRDLIQAAVELARADSRRWEAFIKQLEVYAASQRDLFVQAPIDILPVAQGRAQGVSTLTVILRDCRHEAEVLEKAEKNKRDRENAESRKPLGP